MVDNNGVVRDKTHAELIRAESKIRERMAKVNGGAWVAYLHTLNFLKQKILALDKAGVVESRDDYQSAYRNDEVPKG